MEIVCPKCKEIMAFEPGFVFEPDDPQTKEHILYCAGCGAELAMKRDGSTRLTGLKLPACLYNPNRIVGQHFKKK